ncbi:polysaccharide biosynthesis protein [Deinococcus sp. KSM4-11]|uniref:polysaccharide biosynthesis protein n=1 Tax=Deinococcus sp. KSM4-11 TaxID=2568654 RepID=UPI0010A49237|nr:nucleoside-diphosphate sugar epimerase/dehydratase [Deinococcus sp. KSM4-11]THF87136.1 polysaccharide biosynthesis protein [Deinococcus sp. KSM4-11]
MNTTVLKTLVDITAYCMAAVIAYFLRVDQFLQPVTGDILLYMVIGLPIKALALARSRESRQIWRYVTFEDLFRLTRVVGLVTVIMLGLTPFLRLRLHVPWFLAVSEGIIALSLLAGLRFVTRWWFGRSNQVGTNNPGTRVLIAGAGDAGRLMAAELLRFPQNGLKPVGFIDDAIAKLGMQLMGLPVLGGRADLPHAMEQVRPELLIIAMPSAGGAVIRAYADAARAVGLPTRTVPGLYELLGGHVTVNELRQVSVDDLLRRPPVELDQASIALYVRGRTVLVTGAGGSIGSELVRQLARFHPQRLILVGRGENSVFAIEQEMRRDWPEIDVLALVADVRHFGRLDTIFSEQCPAVVFHAAAHKHVPLMEAAPSEAIRNNIFGTRNVADLCLKHGVQRLVNISTDKAVNPTSVMGASKRVAEMIIADAARRARNDQSFVSVRFGNVLGSRGSVVPTFMQQIRAGGPITVTHPDMTRYFMTIPEASRLVLQAGALADNGKVYVLNMGKPVRIVDLAQDVIRLSGARDIDVVFSGMRPGEKLYEELLTSSEGTVTTQHSEIFSAQLEQLEPAALSSLLAELQDAANHEDGRRIRRTLHEAIHESQLKL